MWNNILISFGIGFGIAVATVIIPVILSYFMVPGFPSSYKEHIEKGEIVR